MGRLVDGKWIESSLITSDEEGSFKRQPRTFLDTIAADHSRFQVESGRYHLYVSYACPWAHRTLIFRSLKELENHISVSVVHPDMMEQGWSFASNFPGATGDELHGFDQLFEVYQKAQRDVSTSVTVPILWDKKLDTIVNNESSQIIRIFNSAFNELTGNSVDFYPEALRSEIDSWNEEIYECVNNGVYRSGFAQSQSAHEHAVNELFRALDKIDRHLSRHSYLVGNQLTEADLRLIPTLLRFDVVYVTHFKANRKRIKDYTHISEYLRRLYKIPAIHQTTHFDHIKRHYYYSHESINPQRIIPVGPDSIF
ncbi:glutathione S-transferase family protein [Pseudobacteriovorax antillogorgiicola]|uniref:Putative glutathione S-transferase n=1 Tax=Pseudobacteriovorax antillogorgiicola TaxID=1513793 RepID=A0A1Y6BAG2_9BACT|nr:glutathione S-transferase family protein [Pseudobacteriovorax antillogorgiicola]TCS58852.1 putative glutathione S-transferase [Pseudobacteriovorax antillogorgiicola]SME94020.1 putative glutathione S-transferase [Pseudobacteriovorax antillogorgiicola]